MTREIERIRREDTDELLEFLNKAFTGDPASGHFESNMPRMCRSEKRLCEHYAVRENGKICAALGVFPYDVTIGNGNLRFATVGNIGVAEECRGKGYMRVLMTEAMRILEETDIDVSRLGGLRSRYENYGYEPCGIIHRFTLTPRNALDVQSRKEIGNYSFREMSAEDAGALETAEKLYSRNPIRIHRSAFGDFYDSLRMWGSVPYVVYDQNGRIAGYLCSDAAGKTVHEYGCVDEPDLFGMLCSFVIWRGQEITYNVYPWEIDVGREFSRFSEAYAAGIPSHFKVLKWEKLISALMEMKHGMQPLSRGRLKVNVSGYGTLRIDFDGGRCSCDREPESRDAEALTLDPLAVCRLCFGPCPPMFTLRDPTDQNDSALIGSWFPLPLSWNPCDNL